MFFFSVTRQSVAARIEAPSVREFPSGEWVVTAATDGRFSWARGDGAEIAVKECLAPAAPATGSAAEAANELVLTEARFSSKDRLVELHKPLISGRSIYYHVGDGGEFYCASHVRLLRAAGVRLEEDPDLLPELFVFRYVSPPRTVFKGIDQLMAGQRLRFEFDGRAWRLKADERYSPPAPPANAARATPKGDGLYGEFGGRTAAALRDAMAPVAAAQGRPHVLLSGGLDSSILFKIAKSDLGVSESHSSSYPFEPEADDIEKRYALTAAEALGARHQFYVPTMGQFLRGVLEMISLAEEPIGHTQSVVLMLLFRDGLPAGPGTIVMGQGADAAFGIRLHRIVDKIDRFRASHPRLAFAFHPRLWSAVYPAMSLPPVMGAVRLGAKWLRRDVWVTDVLHKRWAPGEAFSDPRHLLWSMGKVGDDGWVRRRFNSTRARIVANRAEAVRTYQNRSVYDALSLMDLLSDVSVTQSTWSKFGEAAGKLVYYPFNAPGVLDCAFSAPWDVKLTEAKALLRGAARRLGVPDFIITRAKANFNSKNHNWASPGAALEPLVPLAAKIFDEKEIRRMQSPDRFTAWTFWTMLNYAIWKRLFIHGEPLGVLMEELERSTARTMQA